MVTSQMGEIHILKQLSLYAYPFPHRNYHWVDKKCRHEWTLTRKH